MLVGFGQFRLEVLRFTWMPLDILFEEFAQPKVGNS